MPHTSPFDSVARLPALGDNVAIASQTLSAGSRIGLADRLLTIDYTVLEGHRFAIEAIPQGEPLLSWGLPFGFASRDIEAGNYVCNERVLWALGSRKVDFQRPSEANFQDKIQAYAWLIASEASNAVGGRTLIEELKYKIVKEMTPVQVKEAKKLSFEYW